MSHVTRINVQIKDLQALALASERLGLTLNIGQKNYKWYGHFVGDYREIGVNPAEMGKCDHAISVKGNKAAYEIGVAASKTFPNTYELRYDFWGGGYGLESIVGNRCSKLLEEYTKIVAIKEAIKIAQAQGYQVSTQENPVTGEVIIILNNYSSEHKITLSPPRIPSTQKKATKQTTTQNPIPPVLNDQLKLKVEGCKGDSCKELTKTLEEAMGIVANTENTDEFYSQETIKEQNENHS